MSQDSGTALPAQPSDADLPAMKLPPPPSWEDFWAHQVAEKAKAKVLVYFGVVGTLASVLIALYGVNGIKTLLEDKFAKEVEKKEREATVRIENQLKAFEETKLKSFAQRLESYDREILQTKERYLAQWARKPEESGGTQTTESRSVVDLSADIGPIRDQGPEGTTVGFALAYALQAAEKRQAGKTLALSARSIYAITKTYKESLRGGDAGASVEDALKALEANGAVADADWPYERKTAPKLANKPTFKIASYDRIVGVAEIRAAIQKNSVVIAQISVTEDFDRPDAAGIVSVRASSEARGQHAVCIVGYDSATALFKIANSWGETWGQRGFGYISDVDLKKILVSPAFTIKL